MFRWIVDPSAQPRSPEITIPAALKLARAQLISADGWSWELSIPWQTLVYGFIRRDVDERATLHLLHSDEGWELQPQSLPTQTHSAHAAGAAGVVAMTAAAWLIGGWVGGILPAVAVALAGGLWADVTRNMALQVLERRFRVLIEDVGLEVWPNTSATLLPPSPKIV